MKKKKKWNKKKQKTIKWKTVKILEYFMPSKKIVFLAYVKNGWH